MNRIRWQDHIEIDPDLHYGDACIRGTRVPVATIVGSLADGMSAAEIRQAYPQLQADDIKAALAYAADLLRQEMLLPLAA